MIKKLILFLVFSFVLVSLSWAALPQKINIQGKIIPPPAEAKPPINFVLVSSQGQFSIGASDLEYDPKTGIFTCTIDLTGNKEVLLGGDVVVTIKVGDSVIGSQKIYPVPYAFFAEDVPGKVRKVGDTMSGNLLINVNQPGQYGLHVTNSGGSAIYGKTNDLTSYAGFFSGDKGVKIEGPLEVTGNISAPNLNAASGNYVLKTGDAMTGVLTADAGVIAGYGSFAPPYGLKVKGSNYGIYSEGTNAAGGRFIGKAGVIAVANDPNRYAGNFSGGKGVRIEGSLEVTTGALIAGPLAVDNGITSGLGASRAGIAIAGKGILFGANFESTLGYGIVGKTESTANDAAGVMGQYSNTDAFGILGTKRWWGGAYQLMGVYGKSPYLGVYGEAAGNDIAGKGVAGFAPAGVGVWGQSNSGVGVYGTTADTNKSGVHGIAQAGVGVRGESTSNYGVYGVSSNNYGVIGISANESGVFGRTQKANKAGVYGYAVNNDGYAGYFVGGRGIKIPERSLDPANPDLGTIYFNTYTNKFRGHIGNNVWVDLASNIDEKTFARLEENIRSLQAENEMLKERLEELTVNQRRNLELAKNLH